MREYSSARKPVILSYYWNLVSLWAQGDLWQLVGPLRGDVHWSFIGPFLGIWDVINSQALFPSKEDQLLRLNWDTVGLNIQSLCTGETRMAGYSPHSQSSMFCLCDVSPLGHMCTCWCMRRLMCLCVRVYVEARGQQQAVFFMWCQVTFPRWTLSVACNSLSRAGKEVFQGSACSWDYKCVPPCPCHHA